MDDTVVNKVEESGLITLDLETYYPEGVRAVIDLQDFLYEGVMLREKDFREKVKNHDWSSYRDKFVAVHCSADAIIPRWAFMVVVAALQPFAKKMVAGTPEKLDEILLREAIDAIPIEVFRDQRVMVKGCGKRSIPESAYVQITQLLLPVAQSVFYGEACSAVPVYKRKK